METNKVKLIHHTRLATNELFEVGWFPKYLGKEDLLRSDDLRCLEIRIDGLKDNDKLFFRAMDDLSNISWQLLRNLDEKFLIIVDHKISAKNRVKTYKGLFSSNSQIRKGDFIEEEITADGDSSFFIGMARATEWNRDECLYLARNFLQAFFLISDERYDEIFSREYLKWIAGTLNKKHSVSVNYMKLIPKICASGDMTMSFGWDARGDYVNSRLFYQMEKETYMKVAATQVQSLLW
jgi:hypothetical protein